MGSPFSFCHLSCILWPFPITVDANGIRVILVLDDNASNLPPSRKFVNSGRFVKIIFECLEWNRLIDKMYHILDQNKF